MAMFSPCQRLHRWHGWLISANFIIFFFLRDGKKKLAVMDEIASSAGSNDGSAAISSKLCGSLLEVDCFPMLAVLNENWKKHGPLTMTGQTGLITECLISEFGGQKFFGRSPGKLARIEKLLAADHVPAWQRLSYWFGEEWTRQSLSVFQCCCGATDTEGVRSTQFARYILRPLILLILALGCRKPMH